MSLIEEIEEEVKEAMRARDDERRDALRLILSSLKSAEKELQRPLSEDEELQVLQRERKKRIEAAEAFRAGGREEQAAKEEAELAILEEFMPEPLSEEELERIVDDAIAENRRDEHARHGPRDGRRDAADRRPRRRLGRRPARAREARLATCPSCRRAPRALVGPAAALYDDARPSCPAERSWCSPRRERRPRRRPGIFSRAVAALGDQSTAVDRDAACSALDATIPA